MHLAPTGFSNQASSLHWPRISSRLAGSIRTTASMPATAVSSTTPGSPMAGVADVPLERFARGHDVLVRPDRRRFDRRHVVERARSRLGESRYRVLTNNCEHLCAWALRDELHSAQV